MDRPTFRYRFALVNSGVICCQGRCNDLKIVESIGLIGQNQPVTIDQPHNILAAITPAVPGHGRCIANNSIPGSVHGMRRIHAIVLALAVVIFPARPSLAHLVERLRELRNDVAHSRTQVVDIERAVSYIESVLRLVASIKDADN